MQLAATIKANAEVLKELAGFLTDRRGSIVPFVGAGVSMACGMPGWRAFLGYLVELGRRERTVSASCADTVQEQLRDGHLEDAADALHSAMGKHAFRTALQSKFRSRGAIAAVVQHVVDIADGLIITTNYDRILETAWDESLRDRGFRDGTDRLLPTSTDDLQRALTGDGHAILKLHGDVENLETLVLTKAQYNKVYENKAFLQFLSRFFSSHRPLFIGCSMTEERILQAMRADDAVGYAILARPAEEAEQERLVKRLKDCIRIIWLAPEDADSLHGVHDVLIPLLRWLGVQRRVGRVIWDVDTADEAPWKDTLAKLRDSGKFGDATAWIRANWNAWQSWELAVEFLKFADLAGEPAAWEIYVNELCTSLPWEQPPVIRHAVNYYSGRLHGQSGRWLPAFSVQAANSPHPPPSDRYQILSWFEEGQLRFRTEDFEDAQRMFEELYYLLIEQPRGVKAFVDVLKFLATMQVLDTVYDVPGRDLVWIKGKAKFANPDGARKFGNEALGLAEEYPDGLAWAVTVIAFADEASGKYEDARNGYEKAIAITHDRVCRAATRFHILLYYSAFLRRAKRYDETRAVLDQANAAFLPTDRAPDRLKFEEQRALLAQALGNEAEAAAALRAIVDTPRDATHMYGTTRLERRLRELKKLVERPAPSR